MPGKTSNSRTGTRSGEKAGVLLRERLKELDCLHGVARVAASWDADFDAEVQRIVELLPPGWQHPAVATARITVDGREYLSRDFAPGRQNQLADVVVGGQKRGQVEVFYRRARPTMDEGPFLREERNLIETVADIVGLLVERKDAAEARARIDERLREADRLATIGLLAAGVAHELNEPLSSILGFAQLLRRSSGLTDRDVGDVTKIVGGALYAREIVRQLLIFARQAPTTKTTIDLNGDVVNPALSFFEDRCAVEGVEVVRVLGEGLPRIEADSTQLKQVVINLVVNALQAMRRGGTLTVETLAAGSHVHLVVTDTGVGMTREVRDRIFLPFYTTKPPGQGTGLGLAVVHGIVTDHRGGIRVDSRPGKGSRFEVQLPAAAESGVPQEKQDVVLR